MIKSKEKRFKKGRMKSLFWKNGLSGQFWKRCTVILFQNRLQLGVKLALIIINNLSWQHRNAIFVTLHTFVITKA
jgi:hypothetical protein